MEMTEFKKMVRVVDWISDHKPEVIQEALKALNKPAPPIVVQPNALRGGVSQRTWDYWLKLFGGDAETLMDRILAAQHMYAEKGAEYQFRTPFVVFLERRLDVDLKNKKRDAEKKSKRDVMQELVRESMREEGE